MDLALEKGDLKRAERTWNILKETSTAFKR
jgi:hypothetical protein